MLLIFLVSQLIFRKRAEERLLIQDPLSQSFFLFLFLLSSYIIFHPCSLVRTRMRRSVTKSMWHDWRTLSRDNIIISYGHASKGTDEAACESVGIGRKEGGEKKERVRNHDGHNELRGPLVCLPNNRRLDLTAMKTTSDNRSFIRRSSGSITIRWQEPLLSFCVNRSRLFCYIANDQNRIACWLIENTCSPTIYCIKYRQRKEGKSRSSLHQWSRLSLNHRSSLSPRNDNS